MEKDIEVIIQEETKPVKRPKVGQNSEQKIESALMSGERLCFVITKRRSYSWADDLHSCECSKELDKIYH